MALGPADPRRPDEGGAPGPHDRSIVPGLGEPVPGPRVKPGGPLDMSQDPDRYDPDSYDPTASLSVVGPLDPARDPDRMPRAGSGQSLTDLVGKSGAQEDERDSFAWALGLLGVLAFLALVAFLFGEVLEP